MGFVPEWTRERIARERAERAKMKPADVRLSGGGWYSRGGEPVTLADLQRALNAHGGNQTRFAVEVFGHRDGRQVRKWLARDRMSEDHAVKLRAYLAQIATPKPAARAKAKAAKGTARKR